MLTNNVTKFDDDPLNNIQVTERTQFILANFDNSRAITNIFTKFDDYTMTTI